MWTRIVVGTVCTTHHQSIRRGGCSSTSSGRSQRRTCHANCRDWPPLPGTADHRHVQSIRGRRRIYNPIGNIHWRSLRMGHRSLARRSRWRTARRLERHPIPSDRRTSICHCRHIALLARMLRSWKPDRRTGTLPHRTQCCRRTTRRPACRHCILRYRCMGSCRQWQGTLVCSWGRSYFARKPSKSRQRRAQSLERTCSRPKCMRRGRGKIQIHL